MPTFMILSFALFLTPILVAAARRHPRMGRVIALSLLSGTVIGWFVAMYYACTTVRRPTPTRTKGKGAVEQISRAWLWSRALGTSYPAAYFLTTPTKSRP
jgi:uncharacterized oligopeptide transporter (OPT) family protein